MVMFTIGFGLHHGCQDERQFLICDSQMMHQTLDGWIKD